MVTPNQINSIQKFSLGQLVATPGALSAFEKTGQSPADFIRRHAAGDWGEMCEEDAGLNNDAVVNGGRLMSAYRLSDNTKIWIITEAADENGNREATTILLPDEY